MKDPIYKIIDWDRHFENNRSRTVENLRWVCVPNKHDGEGFSTIMEQENAAELFAAWVLILQVASKCQVRGSLVRDDGTPLTARSLASKTRGNVSWFTDALNFFTTKVKWMECQATDSQVSPACQATATQVTKKGREENGKEGEGSTLSPKGEGVSVMHGFVEFWEAYPKKVAKNDAVKAWCKARPPIDQVLATLAWQVRSREWTKDGGQFIPHPATWLDRAGWEDEDARAVTAKGREF